MITRIAFILTMAGPFHQSFDISASSAQQPGWSPVVIATGPYRQQIKSLPIEQRPNRPFHFYGNSVRRAYYGGGPFPVGAMSLGPYPSQSVYLPPQPSAYSAARPVISNTVPSYQAHAYPVRSYQRPAIPLVRPFRQW